MNAKDKLRTIKKFKQEAEKLKPNEMDSFNKEAIKKLDINAKEKEIKEKTEELLNRYYQYIKDGEIWEAENFEEPLNAFVSWIISSSQSSCEEKGIKGLLEIKLIEKNTKLQKENTELEQEKESQKERANEFGIKVFHLEIKCEKLQQENKELKDENEEMYKTIQDLSKDINIGGKSIKEILQANKLFAKENTELKEKLKTMSRYNYIMKTKV
jgi:hypothetical protein